MVLGVDRAAVLAATSKKSYLATHAAAVSKTLQNSKARDTVRMLIMAIQCNIIKCASNYYHNV